MTQPDKLDPVSAWLVKNGFPLTRASWIEINWFAEKTEADLQAEELAEIPSYLKRQPPRKLRRRELD
jgi:hypothetical protein